MELVKNIHKKTLRKLHTLHEYFLYMQNVSSMIPLSD